VREGQLKVSIRRIILSWGCVGLLFGLLACRRAENFSADIGKAPTKLVVVSSCGDKDVALTMVYMYTYHSKIKGLWDEVEFILWGQSALKVTNDIELQDYIKKMKEAGILLKASQTCADMYSISDKLTALGFDVQPMVERLTELLKDDKVRVITF
jgi:hypothetical protein